MPSHNVCLWSRRFPPPPPPPLFLGLALPWLRVHVSAGVSTGACSIIAASLSFSMLLVLLSHSLEPFLKSFPLPIGFLLFYHERTSFLGRLTLFPGSLNLALPVPYERFFLPTFFPIPQTSPARPSFIRARHLFQHAAYRPHLMSPPLFCAFLFLVPGTRRTNDLISVMSHAFQAAFFVAFFPAFSHAFPPFFTWCPPRPFRLFLPPCFVDVYNSESSTYSYSDNFLFFQLSLQSSSDELSLRILAWLYAFWKLFALPRFLSPRPFLLTPTPFFAPFIFCLSFCRRNNPTKNFAQRTVVS